MSTKTTFKRIALVAVAALGLGVLSVAPSSATISTLTLTVADGTAGLPGAAADSTTAATVNVAGLADTGDSVTVGIVLKSYPAGAATPAGLIKLQNLDSSTPNLTTSAVETITNSTAVGAAADGAIGVLTVAKTQAELIRITNTATANFSWNFGVQFDSAAATTRSAGSYVLSVVVKAYNKGATNGTLPSQTIVKDVTLTIAAASTASKTPSAVYSFADLKSAAQAAGSANGDDAVISKVSTAGTAAGYIFVGNRNAANGSAAAEDSLTATVTGAGVVCGTTGFASPTVGTCGKSIKVAATGDYQFALQADGTAGVSTVSVASSVLGATYTKSVTYYAAAAKTLTASVLTPILVVGSNDSAVAVTAVDANGTNWAGAAYIVASSAADALVGGSATTPVACVYNPANTTHYCPVTTTTAGTAKFKVIDASTVALATATSNEVSVVASLATAASVKIAFDKATYQPGEKAIVTVTPVDGAGNKIAAVSSAALLASSTTAITANTSLVIGGTTTSIVLANGTAISTEAYDGTDKTAGSYSIVVYMPTASGTVTLAAKGGTGLPLAGQVAITASADVVNASVDAATDAANEATDAANAATDAALAAADAADAATAAAQDASDAVAALSASVSKMISNLRAQITSLTNLVIKIQKKVKA